VLITNGKSICTTCRHNLPLTKHIEQPNNEVFSRFYGRLPLEHASSMLYFTKKGLVQKIIHKLKYKNREEVGSVLGDWYGYDLQKIQSNYKFDVIIPVPLHKKRFSERGYNQLIKFGEAISSNLNIPFEENLLKRDVYELTQTKRNFFDRTKDKKTTFSINSDLNYNNNHFLLIDDVITSGATLEACGKALLAIPGSKISIVTLACSI